MDYLGIVGMFGWGSIHLNSHSDCQCLFLAIEGMIGIAAVVAVAVADAEG